MPRAVRVFLHRGLCGICLGLLASVPAQAASPSVSLAPLIVQAEARGLPTKFLRAIPPDFFTIEFADLRAFAAEYHPSEHVMVLDRSLSFNQAGGTLKPIGAMTHKEVGTLFHELFHVYIDYLKATIQDSLSPDDRQLFAAMRLLQECRYQAVPIAPIVQRRSVQEIRFLTSKEAGEALEETWAVFVGWAVWSYLEIVRGGRSAHLSGNARWGVRLAQADRAGTLVGYYEPEDIRERSITSKRYLAVSYRITPQEIVYILSHVFGESPGAIEKVVQGMEQQRPPLKENPPCVSEKHLP